MDYIKAIEESLNMKAEIIFEDIQPGDVLATSADTSELEKWIGFKPKTSIEHGVKEFTKWYKSYYKV